MTAKNFFTLHTVARLLCSLRTEALHQPPDETMPPSVQGYGPVEVCFSVAMVVKTPNAVLHGMCGGVRVHVSTEASIT